MSIYMKDNLPSKSVRLTIDSLTNKVSKTAN